MKNKFKTIAILLLMTNLGFAQSSNQTPTVPAKQTLTQAPAAEKSGSVGDAAKGEAYTVPEGKKGINAVNVKQAKQVSPAASSPTSSTPVSQPTTSATEAKHAVKEKGTGANSGPK